MCRTAEQLHVVWKMADSIFMWLDWVLWSMDLDVLNETSRYIKFKWIIKTHFWKADQLYISQITIEAVEGYQNLALDDIALKPGACGEEKLYDFTILYHEMMKGYVVFENVIDSLWATKVAQK